MQFKSILFLIISSLLVLNGCSSKEEDQNSRNDTTKTQKDTKKPKVIKKLKKNFSLTTVDGKKVNIKIENDKIILENSPNKIVLINFFATWCPPCKAEIPNLVRLQRDFKNDFEVISFLLEQEKNDKDIKEFKKQFKINYSIINSDENFELTDSLGGVKSIPTMFMIDKDSKIFQKYVGLVPSEMMEIDIKKLLAK